VEPGAHRTDAFVRDGDEVTVLLAAAEPDFRRPPRDVVR
jgi:hypothetical protein